jgi:hypothetical protein
MTSASPPASRTGLRRHTEASRSWTSHPTTAPNPTNSSIRAGYHHVEMIECARGVGASANYAGSGGAVVCLCHDDRHRDVVAQALSAIACHTLTPTVEAP